MGRGSIEPDTRSATRRGGDAVRRAVSDAAASAAASTWQSFNGAHPILGGLGGLLGSQSGRVAARDFVEGVAGVPVRAATPAVAAAALTTKPVARAAAAAAAEPDMYERQAAYVGNLFKGGLSLREAQAASGMMPRRAVLDPKDRAIAVATELTQAQFAQRIAAAEKLKASDPDTAVKERDSAAKELIDRMTLLGGANPTNMGYLPGMEEAP